MGVTPHLFTGPNLLKRYREKINIETIENSVEKILRKNKY